MEVYKISIDAKYSEEYLIKAKNKREAKIKGILKYKSNIKSKNLNINIEKY